MNDKEKEYYIKHKGIRCPYCKDDDLISEQVMVDEYISAKVTCQSCKREWVDIFDLVDVVEDF
jgi:transposase-like protein